jgi:hypothetical protein
MVGATDLIKAVFPRDEIDMFTPLPMNTTLLVFLSFFDF